MYTLRTFGTKHVKRVRKVVRRRVIRKAKRSNKPLKQVRMVARHSNLSLDVWYGKRINRQKLVQWSWHGGANQRWYVFPLGGGKFRLTTDYKGKLAVGTDGSRWGSGKWVK